MGASDATLNIFHNSIHLVRADVDYWGLEPSNCFGIGFTETMYHGQAVILNNIIKIDQPEGSAICVPGSVAEIYSDQNVFSLIEGASLGYFNGEVIPTLDQWQETTGWDATSRMGDPVKSAARGYGAWIAPNARKSNLRFDKAPPADLYVRTHTVESDDIDGTYRPGRLTTAGAHNVLQEAAETNAWIAE